MTTHPGKFLYKFNRNNIIVSNHLDPDQDRHFVVPDLGPNCLQRLNQQMTKVAAIASKEFICDSVSVKNSVDQDQVVIVWIHCNFFSTMMF